jgi:hypothetical protein
VSREWIEAVETEDLKIRTPRREADAALAPQAQLLLQRQQSLGNRGVTELLRGRRSLQRAGDPQGLMKEHHASNFTYHHIIPENKLKDFWKKLQAKGHLKLVQAGLRSVTTRGLAQYDEAALSNVKLDLNKEINEVTKDWKEEKFKELVAEGKTGGTSEALAKKYFPGIEVPDNEFHSSYRPIVNIFNKRFKLTAETSVDAIAEAVNSQDGGFMKDDKAAAGVQQLLMWMPGNIHRGPSKRFVPGDEGFDKTLDDGGDTFEEAAKLIISAKQYETVSSLNTAIDTYIGDPDKTDILGTVATLLDDMKAYSVKDYDPSEWEEVTLGPKKKQKKAWRFKKK